MNTDMPDPITLTHMGKLGDFLYCLPIGSWLFKTRGAKIRWVLHSGFHPFHFIEPLLLAQECTHSVILHEFPVRDYGCGGQPYKHHQRDGFAWPGEFFNLGFRHYPDKYLSAFMAEEWKLDFDRDFILELGLLPGELGSWQESARTEQVQVAMAHPEAQCHAIPSDLLKVARDFARAKARYTWFSGVAVLLYLARIPQTIYRNPGAGSVDLYFPDTSRYSLVNLNC